MVPDQPDESTAPAAQTKQPPASTELPDTTFPQPRFVSRLKDTYAGNEVFRWVVLATPVVLCFFGVLWVGMAILLGDRWKLALALFVGADAPDVSTPRHPYAPALVLVLVGYLLVPAFIGAVVSAIISVIAVRRMSPARLSKTRKKYGLD